MALLKGTNPECDRPSCTMVRWNVKRVRRGIFRRESIEVTAERGIDFTAPSGWVRIIDAESPSMAPDEIQSLLLATGHDDDARTVMAKLGWLLMNVSSKVMFFAIDRLTRRLAKAEGDRDRFAATIGDLERTQHAMVMESHRVKQELDAARPEIAGLRDALRLAQQSVRDCVAKGYRATSIRSADGDSIERGDNAFLGTDPERRLILIDCAEAICAENLRVVGLPDGVPVFAKRDNARAWKRSQRIPISSPPTGAPAVPAMPTASPNGTGDGADTAAGEADLLDFIGVRP